jgi:hypothetical protein
MENRLHPSTTGADARHPASANNPPPINYSSHPTRSNNPPPINYNTHPSQAISTGNNHAFNQPETVNPNPIQASTSGWDENDLLEIAQSEYDFSLKRLMRILERDSELPESMALFPDASTTLAQIEVKRCARVLEQMKDYQLIKDLEQDDIFMMEIGY